MEKLAALKSGADMRLQALFFAASAIGAWLIGFVTVFALFKQADAGVLVTLMAALAFGLIAVIGLLLVRRRKRGLAAANSSARIKPQ